MNRKIIGYICPVHKKFVRGDDCPECYGMFPPSVNSLTVIPDIKSFVTEHITGKPIEVRSRRHKKILLKDNRLVEYEKNTDSQNRKGFIGSPGFVWGGG